MFISADALLWNQNIVGNVYFDDYENNLALIGLSAAISSNWTLAMTICPSPPCDDFVWFGVYKNGPAAGVLTLTQTPDFVETSCPVVKEVRPCVYDRPTPAVWCTCLYCDWTGVCVLSLCCVCFHFCACTLASVPGL